MASIKINIVANYLGQGWTALMGLAFVPFYIKYLGIEAYGLIGIFAIMQAWFTLADMGMTPTLSREMARFSAGAHTSQSIRDLVRSLEVICFGLVVTAALLVWGGSSWLATDWLQAKRLSTTEVAGAIALMGLVASLRMAEGLYRGAILGLQRQVWLNVIGAVFATLRWAGAVLVLIWISPSIEAFFLWQGAVSVVTLTVFGWAVHRALPDSDHSPRFSRQALAGVGRFAGGMMATTVLALLLTQVDKIILSRLISLEAFGYYTLAATVASVLYQLTGPITQAFYPRFTELVTQGDTQGMITAYHRGAQLVSILTIPAALVLILYGENLLVLWTGDDALGRNVAPLLALLALGTLLNGMMHIPYMLQLAHGWSGFAARVNIVAVVLLVPAILWVTPRYGAIGAAWVWVLLNAGYVLVASHFMYRRLLPGEKWHWYGSDMGLPLLSALCVAWLSSLWGSVPLGKVGETIWLGAQGMAMLIAALLVAPLIRNEVARMFRAGLKLT